MSGEFKFAIERHDRYAVEIARGATEKGWSVHLPHQCDRWDIAGDEYNGVAHDEAVARMELFVAEATAVLARLKAGDSDGHYCNCD